MVFFIGKDRSAHPDCPAPAIPRFGPGTAPEPCAIISSKSATIPNYPANFSHFVCPQPVSCPTFRLFPARILRKTTAPAAASRKNPAAPCPAMFRFTLPDHAPRHRTAPYPVPPSTLRGAPRPSPRTARIGAGSRTARCSGPHTPSPRRPPARAAGPDRTTPRPGSSTA